MQASLSQLRTTEPQLKGRRFQEGRSARRRHQHPRRVFEENFGVYGVRKVWQ
jgi:hypothetical protein